MLDVLLSRKAWVAALLDAVQAKQISPGEIDTSHRYRLTRYADPELQQRATEYLLQGSSDERAAIVNRYLKSLPLGDAIRGKAIFEKHCAACHVFQGIGNPVGPDIAGLKDKSNSALVREILDPNRAIDQRYAEYLAITADGRAKNGILVEETSHSITLLGQQGEHLILLRSELESLTSSGKSLMPDGFENQVSLQDMADLIRFLSTP